LNETPLHDPNHPGQQRASGTPVISVVIPTYGRVGSLVRCLESLCAQTFREAYEVIVCDDGTAEPVEPSIAHFASRVTLSVVRQKHAGPAAARNTGARHARGQFLAFTDSDCAPAPDWLQRLAERFDHNPGHMIGGSLVNLLPDDPYATATQLIMGSVYDYYAHFPERQRFFSTTNLAVPVRRFWKIDGFSEEFLRAAGEDYDFCARWHEAGFASLYAPEAVVGHAHGHVFGTFWRQHFGYGRALLRVREGMARRKGRSGIELESPHFYRQLLSVGLRRRFGVRALQYTALVFVSQLATAAGAARELLLSRQQGSERRATGEHRSPRTSSAVS
jgi:GT2 family glycosyltransferase